jgi:polysaccharide export outer membrane protein
MKFIRSLFLFFLPIYMISCRTQQKIPNYLQNVTDSAAKANVALPELRIQKDDLLSIQIYSASTRPEVDAIYNLSQVSSTPSGQSSASPSPGFLVDGKGNIQIQKRLTEPVKLLEDPTVIIRFLNLKVTVIGEVNRQGSVTIQSERITILEAIGLSGGLTDYAEKTVKVVRETDGKREIGTVDLSSKTIFESPYYALRQNDLVIVDPVAKKAKTADQQLVIQRLSFGLSVITAIALVYNIFQ